LSQAPLRLPARWGLEPRKSSGKAEKDNFEQADAETVAFCGSLLQVVTLEPPSRRGGRGPDPGVKW